jgi:MFS family permease
LAGIPKDQLFRDIDVFAQENNLQSEIPLLRKGALVAQDPASYESLEGEEQLDEVEVQALRDEVLYKWRHPRLLYVTIVTCSIGAAVQGWDQEGSNGANLSFPTVFGIGSDSTYDTFILGLINSAPFIGSAFIGCWLSDPLNKYFGRRGTIFIAAHFCFWPVLGSAFTQTWPQLLTCRLLLGIGMGAKASSVPIFAAENSPAAIRGALVMTWQMWVAFGIFLGTCANLAVGKAGDVSWRLQLGSAFIPAVPLIFLIFLCPESPRWYMKKGRYHDAYRSLLKLRNHPLQAARDLYYIHAQLAIEADVIRGSNYIKRFTELFTIPRVRRATLAAFVVMIGQQVRYLDSPSSIDDHLLTVYFLALRHQHHRLLQQYRLRRRGNDPLQRIARLVRLWSGQLPVCLPSILDHRHLRPPIAAALHLPQHGLVASRRWSLHAYPG